MKILESYLNDYKSKGTSKTDRNAISNIMFKYLIGSCFKKMFRRAFNPASTYMIQSLTDLHWEAVANFEPKLIRADRQLSLFLKESRSKNETFGDWVMAYMPSTDRPMSPSGPLVEFLTRASGQVTGTYNFDQESGIIFHKLLLSSLYAYLTTLKQLSYFMRKADKENIPKYAGQLCNAIRILFLVTHSNAMKAYFFVIELGISHPKNGRNLHQYNKKIIDGYIHIHLIRLKTNDTDLVEFMENRNEEHSGWNGEEGYMGDSNNSVVGSIYRRSFMSFVDHYAGLCLLERRSLTLPKDKEIELSLIAVRNQPKVYYRPWEDMVMVIDKTCQDFMSTVERLNSDDVIDKIKNILEMPDDDDDAKAIKSFKAVLKNSMSKEKLDESQYPPFQGCIHCESSLAAILCKLHRDHHCDSDLDSDSELKLLSKLFQASSSSHLSSSTP